MAKSVVTRRLSLERRGEEPDRWGNRSISFEYTVNVTSEGVFTTTLPKECVEFLESRNIELMPNRLGNKGYFSSNTLEGLVSKVQEVVDKYNSAKELERHMEIGYVLQSLCAYCKDTSDGTLHPNGIGLDEHYEWVMGNVDRFKNKGLFGFTFHAEIFDVCTLEYCDGTSKVVKKKHDESDSDPDYIKYLCRVMSSSGGYFTSSKLEYVECNEKTCNFFRSLYNSVFMLNERIKDSLDPESIKFLAENGVKLLGR